MAAMEGNGSSPFSTRLRGQGKAPFRGRLIRANLKGKRLVEICSHALDRMRERGVEAEEVLRAIRKPTRTIYKDGIRRRVRKHRSASTAVDVVYETDDDRLIVVTVIVLATGSK
jgi:hypothetical protein